MKRLILVIALFLSQINTCRGKPLLDEESEGDEVLPKVKKSVQSRGFSSKSNWARREFLRRGSYLLPLRKRASDERDDESRKVPCISLPLLIPFGLTRRQLDARTAERESRRLQRMNKNSFTGTKNFPQTFHQMSFTPKSLEDGLVDGRIDSNRNGYDFRKIIKDLADKDWRNVGERRNGQTSNDGGRPPRPG